MSVKVSTKTLILAAVATLGAAALAPASAFAMSRAASSMHVMSQALKGRSVDPNWYRWCHSGCPHPNAIFVRPGNPGNAVFAN
jgi:hypothetical protein